MANLIFILNYLADTSMIYQWVAFSAVVKSVQSAAELSSMVILLYLLFVVLLGNRSQLLVGAKHLEDKLSVIAKNSSPNASPVQLSVVSRKKITNYQLPITN